MSQGLASGPTIGPYGLGTGGAAMATPIIDISPIVTLTDNEQCKSERFRKIDPSQFQGGKTEDLYDFLTTWWELLDDVELARTHGV